MILFPKTINKQSMELKAFHNEEDGQMYQNSDSPVDEFNVTWNFIYTGTPIALKKKVNEKNFGSGLSTRLAVIPMPKTNFEMMAMEDVQTIDWQRIERMKTWAYKLDTRFGELPFWPLVKRIYDWVKNRMEDCAEDNSEANELMLKRVPYHALNYAAPFIDMRHFDHLHLEGKYWEGFGNDGSAYVAMKIKRFSEDRLIERIEDGEQRGKFRKLVKLMA